MHKSYALRSSRMSIAQERAYKELSPQYGIPYAKNNISFSQIYGNDNPVICEIGFGMGGATALIAEACAHKNYLGLEVYKAGIGRLLWEIEKRGIKNIRIIEHDACEVLQDMIGSGSLDGFHIFFPDPWPKRRQQKRRLIQRPFTSLLADKLKPGAYLYMVTDWEDYAVTALAALNATPELRNAYDGFAPPQDWRPQTKFESKGISKSHQIFELFFLRNELPHPEGRGISPFPVL